MPILRRIFPLFIDFTYYTCCLKKGELIMRFRELERIILDDGWFLSDIRGSHHQYKHPSKSGKVIEVIFLCELLILF